MKERTQRAWTIEELTFLHDQRNLKVPFETIGRSLNRTGNACACKFKETDWDRFLNGRVSDDLSVTSNNTEWTLDELTYLYNRRLDNIPYHVIARSLGRSYNACRIAFAKTDWAALGMTNSDETKAHQQKLEAFKDHTNRHVSNVLDRYRMRTDSIADAFIQSARNLPPAELVKWEPSSRTHNHSSEEVGLLLSDLHIGHEHSLEETGGISQYNVDIFRKRMNNLKLSIADIYELHSHLYKIPKLNIFCLGDIVEGMNDAGAWSPVYINTPITDQVFIGVQEMSNAIHYWLTIFNEIEFFGIRGNHGRIASSGAEKDYANWDIIIYKFLETEFRSNPRIKFQIPRTWWHLAKVKDHKFLLLHGDDVKSKNPPISAFLEVERKMSGYVKDNFHYTLAGHFHNASEITGANGKIMMNGSFVGSDVYSIKNCLPGTRAEQKVFGIHSQRGVTFRYDIDLDYERASGKKGPGATNDTTTPMVASFSSEQALPQLRSGDPA